MEMLEFIGKVLEGIGPIAAAGWGLALYFLKLLFDAKKESEIRDDAADDAREALRDKIQEMTEKHSEILLAAKESRIEDLKDLVEKYDQTVNAVVRALEQK